MSFFSVRMSRTRVVVYGAILSSLVGICLIPGGREQFRRGVFALLPSPRPSFLSPPSSPLERGRVMGRELKWSVKLLDRIYIRHFAPGAKLELNLKKARAMFDSMDRRWSDEIAGFSEVSGVDPDILKLGNSFLDLGLNASGCRQIILKTGNGVLHSHNLDWDNLGGVGNYLVTVFRSAAAPGRYRTVHLGFPGMIGVLDIINEKGVSLSFNQLGLSRGSVSEPIFIVMRDIAETCGSFSEARRRILSLPPGMPFCIGLAGSVTGEMAVFERTGNSDPITEHGAGTRGWVAADNMAHSPNPSHVKMIDEIVLREPPQGREDMISLLRNPRILLGCNIYSLIFDFAGNRFFLASGKVPAALDDYREFQLF